MSANYRDLLKYAATGQASPSMTYYERMRASTLMGGVVQTLTGIPPLSFKSDGTPLLSWSMLGNGSQTGTPTPDNPVMPVFVGVRTANLVSSENWENGQYVNGVWETATTRVTSPFFPISEAVHYTITINSGKVLSWININYFDASKTWLGNRSTLGMPSFSLESQLETTPSMPSGSAFMRVTVRPYDNSSAISNSDIPPSKIMVNAGTTALPYEPYGWAEKITCAGQTTPVYLGEVPTVRRVRKLVFDGTEEWVTRSGEPQNVYFIDLVGVHVVNNAGLCTHYPNQDSGSFNDFEDKHFIVRISADGTRSFFAIRDSSFTNYTLRSYLADQYAAGTPVTVWYVLANEETGIVNEPLAKIGNYADELHSDDAGVSIPTVKGSNTLTVETELQPSEMTITYRE